MANPNALGFGQSVYASGMRKTTLELDEDLFDRTRQVLGTRGLKETVQRAFEEVLTLDARRRAIKQLQALDGLDLDRADAMADAWR
jgi:Arc/MetJ family transcription regulator